MSATIPLSCNICPKKPNFSDVSHLLTHIASKGHLSHYYKVKVRASTDDSARNIVEDYDQWYAEWNVEDLMSERMSLKDKKRLKPKLNVVRSSGSALSNPSSRQRGSVSRPGSISRSTSSFKPSPSLSAFDPRLVGHHVKSEPRGTPTPPLLPADSPSLHISLGSSQNLGFRSSLARSSAFDSHRNSPLPENRHAELMRYTYGEARRPSAYVNPGTIISTSPPKTPNSPMLSDNDLPMPDTSKLKGVLWPGMSIFDSATPLARRRRNQKKDASILEQLETNSLNIEPTELVWNVDGSLKKEKKISGMPSSSSPIKSPVRPVQRQPLSEIEAHRQLSDHLTGRYNTFADDRLEMSMIYGQLDDHTTNRKRKRTFNIWQDESDVDNHVVTAASLEHPAPFSYLNHGFDFDVDKNKKGRESDRLRGFKPNFRNDEAEFKPFDDPLDYCIGKENMAKDFMVSRNISNMDGFHSLMATTDDEHFYRTAVADPFTLSLSQQQQPQQRAFGNTHGGSNIKNATNAFGSAEALSTTLSVPSNHGYGSNKRHKHSLSIESLLVGGMSNLESFSNKNRDKKEAIGRAESLRLDTSNVHGPGFATTSIGKMKSSTTNAPNSEWNLLWNVAPVNSYGGCWDFNVNDHKILENEGHESCKELSAIPRNDLIREEEEEDDDEDDDDEEPASVGNRPGQTQIPHRKDRNHSQRDKSTEQSLSKVLEFRSLDEELDEGRTVTAPTSPENTLS